MAEQKEPTFLKEADPTLYTGDLMNLEQSSEEEVVQLMAHITNEVEAACRKVFGNVMQDIDAKKLFVLFEPKLNCDVATDHLAPKSVLPLFSDYILGEMRALVELITHTLYCDISGAIEAVIGEEVSEKLVYEQRTFYETHEIHMLLEQLDQLQALLLKLSTKLSSEAIDELRLIEQIVEQAKARMRIGFVYQSDFRDLKFDSKERETSGNEAAGRLIKKLSNQVVELKGEIARLTKENDRVIEEKIQITDRDREIKKLQDALDQANAKLAEAAAESCEQSVTDEELSFVEDEPSSACHTQSDDLELEQLRDELEQTQIWLAEQKKENLRVRQEYEVEIERLTNEVIAMETSESRPASAHSSCSYHGSRVNSAKKIVQPADSEAELLRTQLAKYEKMFELLTGFDVGAPEDVNVQRELINYNLQDTLLRASRYMFENALTYRECGCQTAEFCAASPHAKEDIKQIDMPFKEEFVASACEPDNIMTESQRQNENQEQKLALSSVTGFAESEPVEQAENEQLNRCIEKERVRIAELEAEIEDLAAELVDAHTGDCVFLEPESEQREKLTAASNLLTYTKQSLKEMDEQVFDKGVETGIDDVSSSEVAEENKRYRMLAEAGKYLKHSEITKDILNSSDTAFHIYQKLFQTQQKINVMQDDLLEQRRRKAQFEYERVLKAYRVHVNENLSSIMSAGDNESGLRIVPEGAGAEQIGAVAKTQPHLYKQEVLLPQTIRYNRANDSQMMTITAGYGQTSDLERTNSSEKLVSADQAFYVDKPGFQRSNTEQRQGLDCSISVVSKSMPKAFESRSSTDEQPSTARGSLPSLESKNEQKENTRQGHIKAPRGSNVLMSVNTKSRIILEVKKSDVPDKETQSSVFRGTNMARRSAGASEQRSRSQGGYLNDDELFTAVLELQENGANYPE